MVFPVLNIMYLLATTSHGYKCCISLGLEKDRELGLCSVKTKFCIDDTSQVRRYNLEGHTSSYESQPPRGSPSTANV